MFIGIGEDDYTAVSRLDWLDSYLSPTTIVPVLNEKVVTVTMNGDGRDAKDSAKQSNGHDCPSRLCLIVLRYV